MKFLSILVPVLVLGLMSVLSYQYPSLLGGFGLIALALTLLWLYSVKLQDSSIIDSFWGMGFVLVAWYWCWLNNGLQNPRAILLCSLVSIWGIRLSLHITIRNHGKGEDYRYQAFRAAHGTSYWWISYFRVYLLQGVLLWIIAVPLFFAQYISFTTWQIADVYGVVIWLIGFLFEAIGDWQLSQFKKNPANKGYVMDKGLWKYTRHPNYFGDAFLWWGYFLLAVSVGASWTIFSPILMTFLLMKVSGVALLEQKLVETKPEYKEYVEKTSAFFPRIPKQGKRSS
jgi:steroid 5-alpha reductase family enzyme